MFFGCLRKAGDSNILIVYFSRYGNTDNPDLSVDVIPIGRVTSDLSAFDSLDNREEITFSLAQ